MNIKCKRGEYEAVIISRACGRQPRTRTIDKDNTQDRQEDKTNMKICETEKYWCVYLWKSNKNSGLIQNLQYGLNTEK